METNDRVSSEKKDSILKTLAIAGFVAILLLVAWLAIQLVHLFPAAFTSLASLADGVSEYQETVLNTSPELAPLTVTANTSLINVGESMTINWSDVRAAGSYVFAYDCVDGIAITQISDQGERAIDCDTNYNIGDVPSLTISLDSEKNRYADVPYTVSFLRTDDTAPRAAGSNVVTVVNTDIASAFSSNNTSAVIAVDTESTEDESDATTDTTETTTPVEEESVPTDTTDTTGTTGLTAGEPFEQEFVFTVPVSDPNGQTDLSASYLGVGEIIGSRFVAGPVAAANGGAIQFSVRNIGSKTSGEWTYRVSLPTGSTYQSDDQAALKPNERAVITIGFPAVDEDNHTFVVSVDESSDRRSANDRFTETITFAE